MPYPGGKGGSGVYQFIINQIPPHRVYIEGYLGGGAILRYKKPARANIGIDLDPQVIENWKNNPAYQADHFDFICGDFIQSTAGIIDKNNFEACDLFIYLDPPYLIETRRDPNRKIYDFDLTRSNHEELLQTIKIMNARIMISGYRSELYDRELSSWRRLSFNAMTRGGSPAVEFIWMNYPKPNRLHDYRYLGKTFTERQRIKRKTERQIKKILNLPELERAAILSAIDDIGDFDYETRQ